MWFTIPMYLRSSEPVDGKVLVEESIYLFEADSEEEATSKGLTAMIGLEHSYSNVAGKEVQWSIESMGQPYELVGELKDGSEVYSRFISR
jgi:hypothetical protein